MAEYSYPGLEQPLPMSQWRSVTLGIGSGVFDEGGGPYAISLDNATNSATIRVDNKNGYAHSIVSGFYHKLDAPMTVSLPAVTSPTTYTIALCYEPLNTSKPVSLKVVTGALDKSAGREWMLLHKVTRQPDQLLSDAQVQTVKPSIAPLINVRNFEDLPEASSVLVATTAFVSSEEATYRVSGVGGAARWQKISGTYFESAVPLNGWTYRTTSPKEIAVTPAQGALQCHFSGHIVHQNQDTSISGSRWVDLGVIVPAHLRAPATTHLYLNAVYFHALSGPVSIIITLNPQTGLLSIFPPAGSLNIRNGAVISFDVAWSAPRPLVSW